MNVLTKPSNQLAVEKISSDMFSESTMIFADCHFSYDQAVEHGLSSDIRAFSFSPGLCLSHPEQIRPVEEAVTDADYDHLRTVGTEFHTKLYKTLLEHPEFSQYAICATRELLSGSNLITKARALGDRFFSGRPVIYFTETGNSEFDYYRNPPWRELAPEGSTIVRTLISQDQLPFDYSADRNHPNFFQRLQCSGWPRLGYRLFLDLWSKLPFSISRGVVYVQRENQLARETAYHLALNGYAIWDGSAPKTTQQNLPDELRSNFDRVITPVISEYLDRLMSRAATEKLIPILLARIFKSVERYEVFKMHWDNVFSQPNGQKIKAVLANAPFRPEDVALYHECKKRDVVFASFQHGVSKEIDINHAPFTDPISEISSSDYMFSFNEKNSEICEGLVFAVGECKTVGVPGEYLRCGSYRKRNVKIPPILFASTALYQENTNFSPHKGITDVGVAHDEIRLIQSVLGKLPHKVIYKSYPEARYFDPDPIFDALIGEPNISSHPDGFDLTHLLPDARVVVVARATSTLSWIVFSEKPVVYLNLKSQFPLREDVYADMSQALFLFDDDHPGYIDNLREFLSQPIETIEERWAEKRFSRLAMRDKLMGKSGGNAGQLAAKFLMEKIS